MAVLCGELRYCENHKSLSQTKKAPYPRLKVQKWYPIPDLRSSKTIPYPATHSHLAYIQKCLVYMYKCRYTVLGIFRVVWHLSLHYMIFTKIYHVTTSAALFSFQSVQWRESRKLNKNDRTFTSRTGKLHHLVVS